MFRHGIRKPKRSQPMQKKCGPQMFNFVLEIYMLRQPASSSSNSSCKFFLTAERVCAGLSFMIRWSSRGLEAEAGAWLCSLSVLKVVTIDSPQEMFNGKNCTPLESHTHTQKKTLKASPRNCPGGLVLISEVPPRRNRCGWKLLRTICPSHPRRHLLVRSRPPSWASSLWASSPKHSPWILVRRPHPRQTITCNKKITMSRKPRIRKIARLAFRFFPIPDTALAFGMT